MARSVFILVCSLILLPSWCLAQSPGPGSGEGSTAVTLRPGDLIKLDVWREEDLTGEFLINEAGVVILPLLGPRNVTGIPIPQLRDMLIEEFSRELRNPAISITPLRRIYVLGEVNKPDMYEVDPTISLAGAIALSGGPTPSGSLQHIHVTRAGEIVHERVRAEESLVDVDIRSGDQIFVERRSWLARNSSFLVSTGLSLAGIAISLILSNN